MKRTIGLLFALLAALALALAACGGDDDGDDGEVEEAAATTTISCEVLLAKQQDPEPGTLVPGANSPFPAPEGRGVDFARVTCDDPIGEAAQYDEFVLVPEGDPPAGDGAMVYTIYTEHGSIDGTWDVAFEATGPCEFNFEVESTWDGGTGAYADIQGTGSGGGDFTDIENAPDCSNATVNYDMEVTGLPDDPEAAFADVSTTDGTVSCEIQLSAQQPFDPTSEIPTADSPYPAPEGRGVDFGRVICDDPVGDGAQYDEFVLVPEGDPPAGEGGMRYTIYTEQGSIDGTWDVSFEATGPCEFNFEIESTWFGGTGAFADVEGTGSGTGEFTDQENAPDCTKATFDYDMEVTGLPE